MATMTEDTHGRSRAAWTAVTIVLVGSLLISVAVVMASWLLAIVGIVLIPVGAAAGKILAMAGFGQTGPARPGETRAIR